MTFSDDVQVRRKVDLKEDDMPQPVTLTAPCWCLAKVRAEAQQEDALRKIETGSLDGLFATVNCRTYLILAAFSVRMSGVMSLSDQEE